MARTLPLLDAAQRRAFDYPPKFTAPQRPFFFSLPEWAEPLPCTRTPPHIRGGFLLQLGYFKARGRFFSAERFAAADRVYVPHRYALGGVNWPRYERGASFRRRTLLLHHFGDGSFEEVQSQVLPQVTHFARQQMNPVAVFRTAADYLLAHRWEAPTYAALTGVVTKAFCPVEQQLTTQGAHLLTPPLRQELAALFPTEADEPAHAHRSYPLTTLKRSLELLRPAAVRANVRDCALLQALVAQVQPVHQARSQYRERAGNLGRNPPISFLKAAERTALEQANSPVSRCKALLAGHVADQLKAGKRNLAHSLSYRPFEACLLDATTRATQRAALPFQTHLLDLGKPGPFPDALQGQREPAPPSTPTRRPGILRRYRGRWLQPGADAHGPPHRARGPVHAENHGQLALLA